ncbi:hypothetical protein CC86DRAFT_295509 [Ophiobolus disseminans]|uniref:Uncharacterized protein n=1 Tax=Ophiobolus disseminans TaxID=1469910 RepID=A0A6A6ZV61_9PLEO|nr:hypothetical protein CC86DRAFT_295509 [Ophiobolus disseminans]
MVFSLLMGVVFALCQHFLYRWLHHQNVKDEDKKFRYVLYGRALAYCAKVAFGGCAVLVLRQRIWRAFRDRALSVLSIDQLFGATEDPTIFGNWEAISSAPFVVAIAMVVWLIPIATIIFSPGALTFGNYEDRQSLELMVPTVNFTAETNKNWRKPVGFVGGGNKRSVMYYNTTSRDPTAPGLFDYYDQPSAELKRTALLLAYNGMNHPNIRQDGRQGACGGSFNCTYEQTFVAPGYQCTEIAKGVNDMGRLKDLGAPFNTSELVPTGRYVYKAEVDFGAYARPQLPEDQVEKGPGGYPLDTPPEDLGVFKSEPVLWIGHSYNTSETIKADDPLASNWTHRYEPRIIRCVHMETEYKVMWDWKEPFFHSMATRKYLHPIIDTNHTIGEDGKPDLTVPPGPKENYISPRGDVSLYKKTAAYYALGEMFRTFLRGRVEMEPPLPGPGYAVVQSDHFTNTRLVGKSSEPKRNLSEEIESFYADMVISLLSAPEMLTVDNERVMVNRSNFKSSFVYVPQRLWQCYAPVIFITLLILAFGALTIWEDGTTFSTGFSRILVTTRNTTLDDISRGACLGNDPFPIELMHTKLKFGVLNEHTDVEYQNGDGYQGVGHCAFGVASEVGPIRRGIPYAGLQRRSKRQKVEKYED